MVAGVRVSVSSIPVLVMMVMMMVTVPVLLLVPGRVAGHYHRLGVLSIHLRAECPGSRPEVGVRA